MKGLFSYSYISGKAHPTPSAISRKPLLSSRLKVSVITMPRIDSVVSLYIRETRFTCCQRESSLNFADPSHSRHFYHTLVALPTPM